MTDKANSADVPGGIRATRDELVSMAGQARRLTAQPDRIRAGLNPGVVAAPTHGQGMEFAESRPWVSGDDVRNMDWRVTARTGLAHTKLFEVEKDQPWIVLVDQRPSMQFGTRVRFKSVEAARVGSMLAWAGHHLGNRVGGALLGAHGRNRIALMRGRRSVLDLIGQLANVPFDPDLAGTVTPVDPVQLERAIAQAPRGAAVFVVSDFVGFDDSAWARMFRASIGRALVGVHIVDALEQHAPGPGKYPVRKGQGLREYSVVDSDDENAWSKAMADRNRSIVTRFAAELARAVQVSALDDTVDVLLPTLIRRPVA